MTGNIIDDVNDLMKLDEHELTEVLLDNKYNKALLRELVRRSLKKAHEYKNAFEYEKYKRKEVDEFLSLYEKSKRGEYNLEDENENY